MINMMAIMSPMTNMHDDTIVNVKSSTVKPTNTQSSLPIHVEPSTVDPLIPRPSLLLPLILRWTILLLPLISHHPLNPSTNTINHVQSSNLILNMVMGFSNLSASPYACHKLYILAGVSFARQTQFL